jgi:MEMO1 family protein
MPILGGFIVPHPPIIIPEIGRGEEEKISSTIQAMHDVSKQINAINPETILIISPHKQGLGDTFLLSEGPVVSGHFGRFGFPKLSYDITIDQALTKGILSEASNQGIKTDVDANPLDHGVLVPLHFMTRSQKKTSFVVVSLSGSNPMVHFYFGHAIKTAIEKLDRNVLVIASGDLSHKLKEDGPYGFSPNGMIFDREVTSVLRHGPLRDLMKIDEHLTRKAAQCGLDAFRILAGILDHLSLTYQLLSYESPFGVGYAVGSYLPEAEVRYQ